MSSNFSKLHLLHLTEIFTLNFFLPRGRQRWAPAGVLASGWAVVVPAAPYPDSNPAVGHSAAADGWSFAEPHRYTALVFSALWRQIQRKRWRYLPDWVGRGRNWWHPEKWDRDGGEWGGSGLRTAFPLTSRWKPLKKMMMITNCSL